MHFLAFFAGVLTVLTTTRALSTKGSTSAKQNPTRRCDVYIPLRTDRAYMITVPKHSGYVKFYLLDHIAPTIDWHALVFNNLDVNITMRMKDDHTAHERFSALPTPPDGSEWDWELPNTRSLKDGHVLSFSVEYHNQKGESFVPVACGLSYIGVA